MSAFDDEFGLFGDEPGEEEERRSTLGARKIASNETIIDEIEPEDEPSPRRFRGRGGPPGERREGGGGFPGRRPRDRAPREPLADDIAIPRAVDLLTFLAQKLVSKPEAVHVNVHHDDKGTVLELEVSPDDIGKVIGRAGRVAQALRTIVRAGAEGRVTVDIIDVDEEDDATASPATSPDAASEAGAKGGRGRRRRGPRPSAAPVADAHGDIAAEQPAAALAIAAVDDPDDDDEDAETVAAAPARKTRAAAKKTAAKKTSVKKVAAKKSVAKKSVAKTVAKKATAVAKKTSAKKSTVKKAASKKTAVKKPAARKKK